MDTLTQDPATREFAFTVADTLPEPNPCPLCGGQAHAEYMHYSQVSTVFCACGLSITSGLDTLATVIENWNRLSAQENELPY